MKKEITKAPDKTAPAAAEPLVFESAVYPILNHYCESCHGPEKQKGKLRLDSLEAVMKGGENGPVVIPGDSKKSSLITRLLLPATDDDHMPPEGKPGPKPAELALIQFWIDRGASPTLKVRDALAPTESRALLEHTLGDTPPSDAVPVFAPHATPTATSARRRAHAHHAHAHCRRARHTCRARAARSQDPLALTPALPRLRLRATPSPLPLP